jgi:hypothetical protein
MLVKLGFSSLEKVKLFEDTFFNSESTFNNTYIQVDSLKNTINIKFKNYLKGLDFVELCHDFKFCKEHGITKLDGSVYHRFVSCDKHWCVDSNIER